MTDTTTAIVTALEDGPASARDLSQRLPDSYANIRQILRRMAKAGTVTKLRRGVYALDCDTAIPARSDATTTERRSAPTFQMPVSVVTTHTEDAAPGTTAASDTSGSCHDAAARARVQRNSTSAESAASHCDTPRPAGTIPQRKSTRPCAWHGQTMSACIGWTSTTRRRGRRGCSFVLDVIRST